MRRADPYPVITRSFDHSAAVLQAFVSPEEVLLLAGDRSLIEGEVELPTMDEFVGFGPEAVLVVERAWSVVLGFAADRELGDLGAWAPV